MRLANQAIPDPDPLDDPVLSDLDPFDLDPDLDLLNPDPADPCLFDPDLVDLDPVNPYREKKSKLDLMQKLATRWHTLQSFVLFTCLSKVA